MKKILIEHNAWNEEEFIKNMTIILEMLCEKKTHGGSNKHDKI